MESVHLGKNTKSNMVHCPYNPSHTMPQKTLILHLTKCPDKKKNMSVCPFNSLHVVKTNELPDHETQCPDRLNFDQMIYKTAENKDKRPITFIGPGSNDLKDIKESWGNVEESNQTISGQSVIEAINQRRCYMKPPAGLTKSERKKYRSQGHEAFSNVDASYNPNSNISDRLKSSTSIRGTNEGSNQTIAAQSVIETINQRPYFMKPPAGLTKSERKKYRSQGHEAFSNVDASYKPN